MASATLQNVVDQLQENRKASEDTTTSVKDVAELIRKQLEASRIMAENNNRNRIEAGRESGPARRSIVGEAASTGANAFAGAAGGLIGLGAGVAGFMAALSVGSMGLKWLGNDYSGLGEAIGSFSEAVTNFTPAGILAFGAIAAAALGAAVFKVNGLTIAGNMTGLGVGISAFMGALALGDKGISWIGAIPAGSGAGLVSTFKLFSDSVTALTPEAIAALGVVIAGSAAFGSTAAVNIMAGMGALGIGISAFMGALALGDAGISWIGAIPEGSGKGLVSTFKLFNDAVMSLTPESVTALGVLIAGSAAFGTIGAAGVMAGMAAIGIGISAFMGALALGDKGISWIGAIPEGSGKGLVSTFKMFNDAIMALSPDAMKAMAVLMAASPAGALVSVGLPLIGVGLAGFVAALAAGDVIAAVAALTTGGEPGESLKLLFTNIFTGISSAKLLEGVDLVALGDGLVSVATGLAAFGVGSIISGLGQAASAIVSFFTGESAFDQIIGLASKAGDLTTAGQALEVIASALGKFGEISFDATKMDFQGMAEQLGYAIPTLAALATGGIVKGSGLWGVGQVEFPEGGILNPNLKLDEMADAIAKVNYVLGQTTTYPVNAQAIPSTSGSDLTAANAAAQATYVDAQTINNTTNNYYSGGGTSIITMPVGTKDNNDRR